MKKLLVAMLVLTAVATNSNAQLVSTQNSTNSGRASDQTNINITVVVPNVLTITPHSASSSVTLNQAQTKLGPGNYIALPSNTWTIWSNREYFVYYQVVTTDNIHLNFTNTTGATDDLDENSSMPIYMLQMRVSNNNTSGTIENGYDSYQGLVIAEPAHGNGHGNGHDHGGGNSIVAGTELIDEAQPGNFSFQTDYQIQSPGYYYVGGTYAATVYIWAVQE